MSGVRALALVVLLGFLLAASPSRSASLDDEVWEPTQVYQASDPPADVEGVPAGTVPGPGQERLGRVDLRGVVLRQATPAHLSVSIEISGADVAPDSDPVTNIVECQVRLSSAVRPTIESVISMTLSWNGSTLWWPGAAFYKQDFDGERLGAAKGLADPEEVSPNVYEVMVPDAWIREDLSSPGRAVLQVTGGGCEAIYLACTNLVAMNCVGGGFIDELEDLGPEFELPVLLDAPLAAHGYAGLEDLGEVDQQGFWIADGHWIALTFDVDPSHVPNLRPSAWNASGSRIPVDAVWDLSQNRTDLWLKLGGLRVGDHVGLDLAEAGEHGSTLTTVAFRVGEAPGTSILWRPYLMPGTEPGVHEAERDATWFPCWSQDLPHVEAYQTVFGRQVSGFHSYGFATAPLGVPLRVGEEPPVLTLRFDGTAGDVSFRWSWVADADTYPFSPIVYLATFSDTAPMGEGRSFDGREVDRATVVLGETMFSAQWDSPLPRATGLDLRESHFAWTPKPFYDQPPAESLPAGQTFGKAAPGLGVPVLVAIAVVAGIGVDLRKR